jgi:2,5-furandicarboxylate decarboxylase 1
MSNPKNMEQFINEYEKTRPEDVIRITKPVDAKFEITAIAKHFEEQNKFPLIVFEKVINAKGEISPFPVVINMLGDRHKLAAAIGSNYSDVALDWSSKVEQSEPKKPVVVKHGEAPCQEVVLKGDDIDLLSLPIVHHHEMDPGAYITAGMFTCHDPETWSANMAFHRGFISGPREIRSYLSPGSHNYWNLKAHEGINKEMKVAYWIGHHPAHIMGAHCHMSYPRDHYTPSGTLAGQALRLVPSQTLGDDFMVPADAEFVIEGIMRPGNRALEGPFGEYPRYYGPQQMSPVMEVTAVTHRKNAMWYSFMVGINNNYSSVRVERDMYAAIKKAVPQVQRVAMPVSGCGMFHCYVQLKKTHDGQPKQAIMAALVASEWVKHVIVVDEDIDIYEDRWVLWAVATRSQWDKDIFVVPDSFGAHLDPSAGRNAMSARGGIDATKPAPPERYPLRLDVPTEVKLRVQLKDYIDEEKLAKVPTINKR